MTLSCEQKADKEPPSAPKARSQAVVSNAEPQPVSTPRPAPEGAKPASSEPKKQDRELCKGQLERAGKTLSSAKLAREAAAGAEQPPEALPLGGGRWTWLNFWAAWCVPCREEIPRLKSWEQRLNADKPRFRLVFVSLDDDARQLTQFLDKQPASGLRSTYWIKEGDERQDWFGVIEMDPDPELPAHILVDPKGMARCVINGAVEDSDFSSVQRIVGG